MKKIFTLLFALYFCLELSAFAIRADTPKLSSGVSRSDSAKMSAPVKPTAYGVKLAASPVQVYSVTLTIPVNGSESIKPLLKSPRQLDSLRATLLEAQRMRDSVKQQIKRNYQRNIAKLQGVNNVDSLKQLLKLTVGDTLKALIYDRIAAVYLNYDTISIKKKQLSYQNHAIDYTLLAIQKYASYGDSVALRKSFDNLAKVYYSQKKYSQAKWFILQSNTLSRASNDVPNIISSLLTLSLVKREIKDYSLAASDLDEALQLSKTSHSQKAELEVLKNYVSLYREVKNRPKEIAMLKKQDSLEENMRKTERAQLTAQNAAQKKKSDSLQTKKKLYSSNSHKLSKSVSSRKIDSL